MTWCEFCKVWHSYSNYRDCREFTWGLFDNWGDIPYYLVKKLVKYYNQKKCEYHEYKNYNN